MNSRELGLVSSAYNSLLGTMGAQSSQQVDSTKSFTSVLDNKMQSTSKKSYINTSSSNTTQVNREKLSAKDSEYEKDREAFVKSDMQQPKKEIVRAEKATSDKVSDQKVINKDSKDTKKVEDVEAIESVEGNVTEEVEPTDDNKVIQALMDLLSNEQLSAEEKVTEINDLLSNLSLEELESLEGLTGQLKNLLMSLEGSLKNFEEVLSKLPATEGEFSSLLAEMQSMTQKDEASEVTVLDEASVEGDEVEALTQFNDTTETDLVNTEVEDKKETVASAENLVDEKVIDTASKETPKETKAEMLKENAEAANKTSVVTEMSDSSSTNNQTSQQQNNSESNQSFTEALKFHSANVKTVAMKGAMASNPFEEKIMQQIIKGTSVSLNVGKDVSEMMIKLNPKELGNVSLKISLENEQLVAKFNVENQTVKEVLESRLEDLRTALSDKGFTIEGLDVSVNQDAEEQFQSYEEFIKQQKGKKHFASDEIEGIEGIEDLQSASAKWQTLETTSSEINVLA